MSLTELKRKVLSNVKKVEEKKDKNGILRQRGELSQGKEENKDGEMLTLTERDRGTTKDH